VQIDNAANDPGASDELRYDGVSQPDARGHFGPYGGRFVSETLMAPLQALTEAYLRYRDDPQFLAELQADRRDYVGRPSPIYHAERLSREAGGAQILLKREDLNHTGAHKINNTVGQAMLAQRMGKTRIIAETGAGQHGVATATVCARFGLKCVVYMGATDVERQAPNVFRMRLLGAEVVPVTSGRGTLKDAMNDALRDWVTNVRDTFYCIGTVAGPAPYPAMVRDFQSIIGKEVRWQLAEQEGEGRLPDTVIAAIGGGSNAMGLFYEFLDEPSVNIVGVEAGGKGVDEKMEHCASLTGGRPGVLHGNRTYLLQDEDGQILEGHSISAGLDYPGIGPEHSWLHDTGRATYVNATDKEALEAFQLLCKLEGIIPALEPSHALAHVIKLAPTLPKDHIIVMNMCGRGDKDIFTVAKHLGFDMSV
jgi:tryptophan synthase beta chain